MFAKLFLLLLIVPIVEIIAIVQFHQLFTSWMGSGYAILTTAGIMISTAFAGSWLARQQGLSIFKQASQSTMTGKIPSDEIVEGTLVLLGAALLLTPGYITDLIGFSFLIPWTRWFYRKKLVEYFRKQVQAGSIRYTSQFTQGPFGSSIEQEDFENQDEPIDVSGRFKED